MSLFQICQLDHLKQEAVFAACLDSEKKLQENACPVFLK